MKTVLTALGVVASILTAMAQQLPVFRTSTDVVIIDVTVMDGRKPVTTLTKADFRLTDDGVAQTLIDAGREPLPLDVTFTIDISGSVTEEKRATIERAITQVGATLRPEDRYSVVSFGSRVVEQSPMAHPPVSLHLGNRYADSTSFLDALLLSLVTAPTIGRRQLNLILTDGVDTTSFFKAPLVLDTMRFASGQTSVILVRGQNSNLGGGPARDLLKTVTATSGGQIIELDRDDALKDTFLAALDAFRTGYQLRYSPSVSRPGWHPVVVTVGARKYTVRARQGYWMSGAVR